MDLSVIDKIMIPKSTILGFTIQTKQFKNEYFQRIFDDLSLILKDFVEYEKIETISSKNLVTKWEEYKEKRSLEYLEKNHKDLLDQIQNIINKTNFIDLKLDLSNIIFDDKIHGFDKSNSSDLKYIEYSTNDYHLLPYNLHEFIYLLNCKIATHKKETYTDKYINLCKDIFNIESLDNPDPIYQI